MSPISNMLNQLKNAQSAGLESVSVPFSGMKLTIAEILKKKGFIGEVESKKKKGHKAEIPFLSIELKYIEGEGAINGVKFISKPSRRMYSGKAELKPVKNGYGISVVSTPKGIMTGDEARKEGIGGEVLFEIW